MKNLKTKIRDFLNSEEGRVGIKAPLALGVAAGGLMLAQAVTVPKAYAVDTCSSDADCGPGEECKYVCFHVYNHELKTFECEYHHVCVG